MVNLPLVIGKYFSCIDISVVSLWGNIHLTTRDSGSLTKLGNIIHKD